jgi:hypothetical protein
MEGGAPDVTVSRVGEDAPVLLGQFTDDPAGHAGEQDAGGYFGTGQDHRARGDQGARADSCAAQDDGADPDQRTGPDLRTVNDCPVAQAGPRPQDDRLAFVNVQAA